MKHIIDLNDFSLEEVDEIIDLAVKIKNDPTKFSDSLKGKILATLFFEASTRTQFSFQTASFKLGCQSIGFSNSLNSSISKGESFKDTIKVVSSYSDFLVIRHFLEGAAMAASLFSSCPVINAGDGAHLHPTQTLTDIFTILEHKKSLTGLTIGICGDLKYGRAVNSLLKFLVKYKNNRFVLISSEDFKLSAFLKNEILKSSNYLIETSSLEEEIANLDVLYMTRMQKERFKEEKHVDSELITLNEKILKLAKKDLIILHPLPRTDEISIDVDKDNRAVYFNQALNGVFVRMALIYNIFNLKGKIYNKNFNENNNLVCSNKNCITCYENYLPKLFRKEGDFIYCQYCDANII